MAHGIKLYLMENLYEDTLGVQNIHMQPNKRPARAATAS